jgi:NAD(P)-dependent dehydrogenase (short-subunit alcohol dehydrogenase family)
MTGKVCVISGATSGVGLSAARRLARGGAHLVLLARNPAKAEAVRQELSSSHRVPVEVISVDFSSLAEVRRAAEQLLSTCPRIDVLINSAGLYNNGRRLTAEGFEEVFCVNHLAPFLLTHLLLERLKARAPTRIIHVNSEGHRFSDVHLDDLLWKRHLYTGLGGYGASKTAQLLTTWEFADRLAGSGVTINAMHPGDVKTNIGNNNGPLYRWYLHNIIWRSLKDPVISGEALYFLAAAPEMVDVSGRFFYLTIDEVPASHAMNRAKGKLVWDTTLKLVGLS